MSQAAAIYCRISQDREGAGLGVERQEEDCRALAEQLGFTVAGVYADNDMSAYKRSMRRPRKGYEQMLADAGTGRFGAILAWHTDRLHRSNVELEHYIDVCQPRDMPTHTVKAGRLDMSTAAGRLHARMLGVVARYQSEHMAEQIQRRKEQRVKSGGNAGGPRPFGFEADGLTIRESEAGEIARMTQAIIDGRSLSSLVRDLNARGVTTSTGIPWTTTKLRLMLMRPRNAGILLYQGKEAGEAPWAPIVPELTWRQMRAVFADPSRRTTQNNRISSLGSGLYVCGKCGATLHISASGAGSKVRGYRCSEHNHLTQAAAPLDAYVIRCLAALVSQREVRERYARLAEGKSDAGAQNDIHAAEARLAELGEMFAAGEIDARTLKAATAKLRGQIAEAEKRIGASVAHRPAKAVAEAVAAMEHDPAGVLQAMPLDMLREILNMVAVVIVMPAKVRGGRFDPGRVDFRWAWELDAGYWEALNSLSERLERLPKGVF